VGVWVTGLLTAHALLPVALSRRWRRVHRVFAQPSGPAQIAGVGCLAAGTAGLVWSLAQHYEAAPARGYELLTLAPEYLLREGPYRLSRNPMYVSELLVWAGWILLLSDPVLAGLTGLFALGLNRAARLEETALAARFGETWHEYAARTPRWIGVPRAVRGRSVRINSK
jgi:protein-S-isoprenylcysteine O-methyltransferase Ste14